MCFIFPHCSLLKLFEIQNWRRGWDQKGEQDVHMAAVIGNLGPFDEKCVKFSDYAGRFEVYVAANGLEDEKKVNVFLAVIGPDAYKLLKNLCDPDNPSAKTFTALSQLLQGHCEPAPTVIAERHKFWPAS